MRHSTEHTETTRFPMARTMHLSMRALLGPSAPVPLVGLAREHKGVTSRQGSKPAGLAASRSKVLLRSGAVDLAIAAGSAAC